MFFDPDIFPKSPDSGGSEVQMCTGQPVGCAVEQKTVNNPTAGADVTSEVTDHLDQPRDDPSVAASSLGCSTEVTNDARVSFSASVICKKLEARWFQGGFLISVLGFNHIHCTWQPNSSRFHHIF